MDISYSFFLDGQSLQRDYLPEKGYIITFTMPSHDVKLTVEQKNIGVE